MSVSAGRSASVVRGLATLFRSGTTTGLSEAQLLKRFAQQRDESAFRLLVERHGPRVLGVCRRVLRDVHLADDAFQATFLVLARRANAIGDPDRLGGWLSGVARRVARKSRAIEARRAAVERAAAERPRQQADDVSFEAFELRGALDEELDRLPEDYRKPLVLCCLEGKSTDQAAEVLGWPRGTVGTRVARGRERLRRGLERRGLALTTVLAAPRITLPASLIQATAQSALSLAKGQSIVAALAGVVPARIATLAQASCRSMFMQKVLVIAAAGLLATAGGAVVIRGSQAGGFGASGGTVTNSVASPRALDDQQAIQGTWVVTACKINGQSNEHAEAMMSTSWTFSKDQFQLEVPNLSMNKSSFRLDASTNPKTMFVKSGSKEHAPQSVDFAAVYSLEGDKLRLAFVGGSDSPPSALDAQPKEGKEMIVLELVPMAKAPKPDPAQLKRQETAVSKAREAAARAQSANNLKQIMLAMHNYQDIQRSFPSAAICDADGKPLLSWRVAILPFLEQDQLYRQFHLNESWDSPHNKALLEKMPKVYAPVGDNVKAEPGTTYYQVFVGGGSLFEPNRGRSLAQVTDGTSNTIAVVEGNTAVPWTKPQDIPYDPMIALPKLGEALFPKGFNAAFADGSVRFILLGVDPTVLRALITCAGGEAIAAP